MFIILVHGESCDYYIGMPFCESAWTGVLSRSNARAYDTEEEARLVGQSLFQSGAIGRWEIIRA